MIDFMGLSGVITPSQKIRVLKCILIFAAGNYSFSFPEINLFLQSVTGAKKFYYFIF